MTSSAFLPSHVVPPEGMATWSAPDASLPSAPLDPLLPVQVVDRRGDWALALCSNGWSAWVDGRLLLTVPREPPTAAQPAARTADPRPLLGAAEGELGRYRQLVEELAAGRIDRASFAERTRGTRVGVVVDGDAVWLYDARHERWCYCDGVSLQTYAVSSGPSSQRSGQEAASASDPGRPEPGRATPSGPRSAAPPPSAPGAQPTQAAQYSEGRSAPPDEAP
ncbi:hypothetical protein ACWD6P_05565 [Streptomyces sp. NPDC002446]